MKKNKGEYEGKRIVRKTSDKKKNNKKDRKKLEHVSRETIQRKIRLLQKAKNSIKSSDNFDWILVDLDKEKSYNLKQAKKVFSEENIHPDIKKHPIVGNIKRYRNIWIPEIKAEVERINAEKGKPSILLLLPPDIMRYVFKFLSNQDVMNIFKVNKHLNKYDNDRFWIILLNRDYPIDKYERPKNLTKKQQYFHNVFNFRYDIIVKQGGLVGANTMELITFIDSIKKIVDSIVKQFLDNIVKHEVLPPVMLDPEPNMLVETLRESGKIDMQTYEFWKFFMKDGTGIYNNDRLIVTIREHDEEEDTYIFQCYAKYVPLSVRLILYEIFGSLKKRKEKLRNIYYSLEFIPSNSFCIKIN